MFIRSSTRSPKDSVIKTEKFQSILSKELEKNRDESMAVISTFSQCLRCDNGTEAFDMLVNSERIYTDFTKVLLYLDESLKRQPDHIVKHEQIIIRKFDVENRPELEFRCFVRNGILT